MAIQPAVAAALTKFIVLFSLRFPIGTSVAVATYSPTVLCFDSWLCLKSRSWSRFAVVVNGRPAPRFGERPHGLRRNLHVHNLHTLRDSAGVVTTAAKLLGLHRTTLNAMTRKLGITRKGF
jgi:hypothetical protein